MRPLSPLSFRGGFLLLLRGCRRSSGRVRSIARALPGSAARSVTGSRTRRRNRRLRMNRLSIARAFRGSDSRLQRTWREGIRLVLAIARGQGRKDHGGCGERKKGFEKEHIHGFGRLLPDSFAWHVPAFGTHVSPPDFPWCWGGARPLPTRRFPVFPYSAIPPCILHSVRAGWAKSGSWLNPALSPFARHHSLQSIRRDVAGI